MLTGRNLAGRQAKSRGLVDRVEGEGPDPLLEEFLAGLQFERELQNKLPELCNPSFGAGREEGVAWHAAAYQRFSLERLLEGKVHPGAVEIHELLTTLLGHLKRIKEATGRVHGNLKPSNIYLEGEGPLTQCAMRFGDFAGLRDPTEKGAMERRDLSAVGRLLYQMVSGQEARSTVVSDQGDWAIFGKKASLWTAFCEDLLKADTGQSVLTVDQILEQLPTLKPVQPKPWGVVGAVAGAAAIMGLVMAHFLVPGGLLSFFQPPPPISDETRMQWQSLVQEYEAWGEAVNESLSEAVEAGTGRAWHADPYLFNQVLEFYEANVLEADVKMDPWEVLDRRVPWQTLDKTVPEILGREKYVLRTEQSLQFMEFLRVRLESWPALEQLETLAATYRERRWEAPAAQVSGLRESFAVDAGTPKRVDQILENIRVATQINRVWETAQVETEPLLVEGRRGEGANSRTDPLLENLDDFLLSQGRGAEDLEAILEGIQSSARAIRQIREVVESEAYREQTEVALFREESFLADWQPDADPARLTQWQNEVLQYRTLKPDAIPLRPTQWEEGYATIRGLLEKILDLDELVRRTGEVSPLTPEVFQGFQSRLAELEATGREALNLPRVVKYETPMDQLNRRIFQGLDALEAMLRDFIFQLRPDPDEWLKDVNSRTVAGSAVLEAFWSPNP